MKRIVLILLLAVTLIGCSSFEKQHFKARSFYMQNKDLLAEMCAGEFPSKTEFIKGDEILRVDTLKGPVIYIECPDGTRKKCPESETIYKDRLRVDTLKTPNLAYEKKLNIEINNLDAENRILKAQNEVLTDRIKHLTKWIVFLSIGLAFSLALLLRKIFK